MKKILLSLLCLGVVFPALAKDKNKGFVFVPQSMTVETIADVKNKADDTIVVIQGRIAKSLGDEKYTFTDQTGEIIIEIDNEDFNGVTVTSEELLEIVGEVDKEKKKPAEIDVKSIKKLDKQSK